MPRSSPARAGQHLVLLGDSILDNRAYIRPDEPDVAEQVAARLPGWSVTTLARDGAVTADILSRQLRAAPGDATDFLVCIGGNDMLGAQGILTERAERVGDALLLLDAVVARFVAGYGRMLAGVVRLGRPVAVCLPYEPQFPMPAYRRAAAAALGLFADRMQAVAAAVAAEYGTPISVVDLRAVCRVPDDFANAIEPSAAGGARIADAIVAAVTGGA